MSPGRRTRYASASIWYRLENLPATGADGARKFMDVLPIRLNTLGIRQPAHQRAARGRWAGRPSQYQSSDLSTGLRKEMNIVRGFITDPDALFLDEPTLGLDVGASRDVGRFIRSWVRTIRPLLTVNHALYG